MVVVSLATEEPDAETQAMVDTTRDPSGEGAVGGTLNLEKCRNRGNAPYFFVNFFVLEHHLRNTDRSLDSSPAGLGNCHGLYNGSDHVDVDWTSRHEYFSAVAFRLFLHAGFRQIHGSGHQSIRLSVTPRFLVEPLVPLYILIVFISSGSISCTGHSGIR